MHQVEGEYPDYNAHLQKNYFFLNADKAFDPYNWKPPIHWKGNVGGIKVKFTQISSDASNVDSFDWTEFPKQLEEAKLYIVKAINKAMRIMD